MTMHSIVFFFFNDTATTEIYTLSLHDALPIYCRVFHLFPLREVRGSKPRYTGLSNRVVERTSERRYGDRKSTRLNSSHANISYAVFCLKKKTIPTKSVLRMLSDTKLTNLILQL